jgi:hypothetical protein
MSIVNKNNPRCLAARDFELTKIVFSPGYSSPSIAHFKGVDKLKHNVVDKLYGLA